MRTLEVKFLQYKTNMLFSVSNAEKVVAILKRDELVCLGMFITWNLITS